MSSGTTGRAAALVNKVIDEVLAKEGAAYTNRASDAGGPTKYGITQRTLSGFLGRPATPGDVQDLTEARAREIYWQLYVRDPGFVWLLELDAGIGAEVIDTGVNCGTQRAAEFLQRCLNVFNRQGRDYADIKVDGAVGPATVAALRAFLAKRGSDGAVQMLKALNCLQGAFYIGLAERRAFDEDNLYGWLRTRVVV